MYRWRPLLTKGWRCVFLESLVDQWVEKCISGVPYGLMGGEKTTYGLLVSVYNQTEICKGGSGTNLSNLWPAHWEQV